MSGIVRLGVGPVPGARSLAGCRPGTLLPTEGASEMGDAPLRPGSDVLARRLAEARRLLSQVRLPAAESDRLRRQFIAVCDAIKAPEADVETGLRRVAAFMTTLEQASAKASRNSSHRENSMP
jgi:hypothetical protein